MNERETKRLVVTGRVQGVFYRESMKAEAARLGIRGWVRNRIDGSVEAVVQGTPESVGAIIAWARRGPADAEVTGVEAEEATGEFHTFEKRTSQ